MRPEEFSFNDKIKGVIKLIPRHTRCTCHTSPEHHANTPSLMLIFTHPLYNYNEHNPTPELTKFFDSSSSLWLNDWVSAHSAVRHSNGKIYVTTNLNGLYEIDPNSGGYRRVSQSTWAFCRLVSFENQLLCFGSQLTVVDPATGASEIWMLGEGILDSYWSRSRAAAVHMDKIYVATQSNCLYCIGSDRKATLVSSKHNWSTCSALLSWNGQLYATLGSTLVTIDIEDGTTELISGTKSHIQCGIIGQDNNVYVISRNGSLYKLDSTKKELFSIIQKSSLGVASTMV